MTVAVELFGLRTAYGRLVAAIETGDLGGIKNAANEVADGIYHLDGELHRLNDCVHRLHSALRFLPDSATITKENDE